MRTITFHAARGIGASSIATSAITYGSAWGYLTLDIAQQFGVSLEDIHTEDFTWDDGERFADFVVCDGQILGSLDELLTASDWKEVLALHSCAHLRESLANSVKAA